MSGTKSFFWGVISSQVYMVISILLNLISTPFIIKSLSAEVYGLSIIIFQITSYLGMFDFGLGAGVTRFLAGSRANDKVSINNIGKIISTSFYVYIILGAIVAITGVIIAPFLPKFFHIHKDLSRSVFYIVSIISIFIGSQFLIRAISGVFFAHQRQALSNTLSFILNVSNTLFTVFFVARGNGLWSFVYAQIIVFILNAFLNVYFFKKYYSDVKFTTKNFDKTLLKEMFSYGFFLFLTGITIQIVFETDRILIGATISLSAVAVYSVTTRFPELISQFIWKISDNSFPNFVELSKGSDISLFTSVHNKIMELTLFLSTSALWLILLFSPTFIKLWVGSQYYAGLRFTIIVVFLYLIQLTVIHVSSVCLNGAGKVKTISLMSLLEAALNLTLSIVLGRRYGIVGIVLATLISAMLTTSWYVPYKAIHFMKTSVYRYLLNISKPIFLSSVIGILLFVLFRDRLNGVNSWSVFLLYSVLISLVYFVPIMLLNKNLFQTFKNKIFTK